MVPLTVLMLDTVESETDAVALSSSRGSEVKVHSAPAMSATAQFARTTAARVALGVPDDSIVVRTVPPRGHALVMESINARDSRPPPPMEANAPAARRASTAVSVLPAGSVDEEQAVRPSTATPTRKSGLRNVSGASR